MSKQIKLTDFDNGSELNVLVLQKVNIESAIKTVEAPQAPIEVPETTVEVQPC